ncbi:MAG: hypothetical protein IPF88_03590 [Candidatus Microthrix sp.]|nr:hypothetical protein [Candidatus Microthrix sp.]
MTGPLARWRASVEVGRGKGRNQRLRPFGALDGGIDRFGSGDFARRDPVGNSNGVVIAEGIIRAHPDTAAVGLVSGVFRHGFLDGPAGVGLSSHGRLDAVPAGRRRSIRER